MTKEVAKSQKALDFGSRAMKEYRADGNHSMVRSLEKSRANQLIRNRFAKDSVVDVGSHRVKENFKGIDPEVYRKQHEAGNKHAVHLGNEFVKPLRDLKLQAERGLITWEDAGREADKIVEKSREVAEAFKKSMEPQIAKQKQAKVDAAAKAKAKDLAAQGRRSNLSGFGKYSELLNTKGLSGKGARAVARTIPGASEKQAQGLASKLTQLQAAGKATKENIDQLLEELMMGIQAQQKKTQAAKEKTQAINEEVVSLQGEIASSTATDAIKGKFQESLLALADSAEQGQLDTDSFKQKVDELREAFLQAAKAADVAEVEVDGAADAFQGGAAAAAGGGGQAGRPRQLNRIGGDALSWTKDVADFFGSDVKGAGRDFRKEVEKTDTRPLIQQIFDQLAPGPHPFISVSGEAGPGSLVGSKPGGGGTSLNVYVQKMTDSDIRHMYAVLQQESRRRGRPF